MLTLLEMLIVYLTASRLRRFLLRYSLFFEGRDTLIIIIVVYRVLDTHILRVWGDSSEVNRYYDHRCILHRCPSFEKEVVNAAPRSRRFLVSS